MLATQFLEQAGEASIAAGRRAPFHVHDARPARRQVAGEHLEADVHHARAGREQILRFAVVPLLHVGHLYRRPDLPRQDIRQTSGSRGSHQARPAAEAGAIVPVFAKNFREKYNRSTMENARQLQCKALRKLQKSRQRRNNGKQ